MCRETAGDMVALRSGALNAGAAADDGSLRVVSHALSRLGSAAVCDDELLYGAEAPLRAVLDDLREAIVSSVEKYTRAAQALADDDAEKRVTEELGGIRALLDEREAELRQRYVQIRGGKRAADKLGLGGLLIVGGRDRNICLVDEGSGETVRRFEGAHTRAVTSCAAAPSTRRVVSASQDGTAVVWDVDSGEASLRFREHSDALTCVVVTSDGATAVTGSKDASLLQWDVDTGAVVACLVGHSDWCYDCKLTADDRMLVSASADKTLRVWDLFTGTSVQKLVGHKCAVLCCAVTDNGARVVSGSRDKTARVWNTVTGETLMTFSSHTDWITSCCFLNGGFSVATGSADHSILIWDADTGAAASELKGHTNWVNAITAIDGGRRLASVSEDKTMRTWDVETGESLSCVAASTVWCAVSSSPAASPTSKPTMTSSRTLSAVALRSLTEKKPTEAPVLQREESFRALVPGVIRERSLSTSSLSRGSSSPRWPLTPPSRRSPSTTSAPGEQETYTFLHDSRWPQRASNLGLATSSDSSSDHHSCDGSSEPEKIPKFGCFFALRFPSTNNLEAAPHQPPVAPTATSTLSRQ